MDPEIGKELEKIDKTTLELCEKEAVYREKDKRTAVISGKTQFRATTPILLRENHYEKTIEELSQPISNIIKSLENII